MLESLAVVGLDLDLGMQGEAVDVAAQLAGDEERVDFAAVAEAVDRAPAVWTQGHAALHRGGIELSEERLVGLGR